MKTEWAPSFFGKLISRHSDWHLRLIDDEFELTLGRDTIRAGVYAADPPVVRLGLFWSAISFPIMKGMTVRLNGLPNSGGRSLAVAIARVLRTAEARKVDAAYGKIAAWLEQIRDVLRAAASKRRWISHEEQLVIEGLRPDVDLSVLRPILRDDKYTPYLRNPVPKIDEAFRLIESKWTPPWGAINEEHTKKELVASKGLFDRVESRPLTEEQARAVICFDNRVQVVASAGSGKTSTMVARAAYAIERGFVEPHEVIMLAFNKAAAEELGERTSAAFARLGRDDVAVPASTFHALGLQIIARATGKKPTVPEWAIDQQSALRKLAWLIGRIKDRNPAFRARWDLFRIVLAKDLPAPAPGTSDPPPIPITLDGRRVKSHGERLICDWLFYQGVRYQYEKPYEFDTATETYRQYHPDFYYPEIRLYHEHLAFDKHGRPPPKFQGYMESVQWKRALHAAKKTDLIETTFYEIINLSFEYLETELTRRGLVLDPNPERRAVGDPPVPEGAVIGLIRTFVTHMKSNSLSVAAIRTRVETMPDDSFRVRYRVFLDIVEEVAKAWDNALAAEGGIDFEDMLNRAADVLEEGLVDPPFRLVLADEFQDASKARARLCRALVSKPHRYLLAVGDDWQSINRFAGADVSVMTKFSETFGTGQTLKLEKTFRCPQEICDISSEFVSKNPAQLRKKVESVVGSRPDSVRAFEAPSQFDLLNAITAYLDILRSELLADEAGVQGGKKATVKILGRYNNDKRYLPENWKSRFGDVMDISFLTVHRSKGSEADYIILPAMVERGFPNQRADDSILTLAMPDGDSFPYSEERRLFYVALTRARKSVAMFTARGKRSSFLGEIMPPGSIISLGEDGYPKRPPAPVIAIDERDIPF